MPRALVVYFSQGGTTAQVAEAIAAGLRRGDYQCDLYNIRDDQPPSPDDYDLLGIGSPTYCYRPSFTVMDYVNSLPNLAGKPAFVFMLYGTYAFDAVRRLQRALERHGASGLGRFQSRGVDYFLGYLKEGYLFSPGHPTADELAQAEAFGLAMAANPAERGPSAQQDHSAPAMYRLERLLLSRWLARQAYSRMFSVRASKCTACGLCEKVCPTRNVTLDARGRPVWGRECLLCQSCEIRCPQDAITSPLSWPIMRPFMMYNVRQASRDPAQEFIRVKHSGGQTRPVGEDA